MYRSLVVLAVVVIVVVVVIVAIRKVVVLVSFLPRLNRLSRRCYSLLVSHGETETKLVFGTALDYISRTVFFSSSSSSWSSSPREYSMRYSLYYHSIIPQSADTHYVMLRQLFQAKFAPKETSLTATSSASFVINFFIINN